MRRELKFECLDDAIEECERLIQNGYTKSGKWSLAQICCHLRLTIESNMNGYPLWMTLLGYPLRPVLRSFVLPKLLDGNSPNGIKTARMFIPPDDLNDAYEVDRFKTCVSRFGASSDSMHAHPGFGNMTNRQFDLFHASHAAHHLSFLHPETNRV